VRSDVLGKAASTIATKSLARIAGLLAIAALSCSLPALLPLGNQAPPELVGTLVAQTAGAVLTQTAAVASPTSTITPTSSPTGIPTVFPTFPPTITLTPFLGASAGDLDCSLIFQSPRNGVHFQPREHFDVGWKVRNTGRLSWDPETVYFAYLSGTKMDLSDVYHLPESVPPDGKAALSASLVAPRREGGYTTVWALRRGDTFFCRMSITINVP
jgi:Ig-like domain from next to BRCA1 gene